ncbi:MAG: hypothetical protein ACLUGG_03045 [Oscillospiraceae bacterium]
MKKRLVPILLSLVMVLMLLPSLALAADGEGASSLLPAAPTTDKLPEILSGPVVQVSCFDVGHAHAPASYPLKPGSYTVGKVAGDAVEGYTCPVVIQASAYIAAYNDETSSKHSLSPQASAAQTVALTWDGAAKQWKAPGDKLPLVFPLACEGGQPATPRTPVPPSAPTDGQLPGILGESVVKVACANPKAAHGEKTYGLLPGSYAIGSVAGDEAGGYTCPVTIYSDPYVAAYNAVAGAAHTLQPDGQAAKSITLSWDGANQAWALRDGLPLVFPVLCKDAAAAPQAPASDQLPGILGSVVKVACANSRGFHGDKTYALLPGSYTIGTVAGDQVKGYTCPVTIHDAAPYVAAYNADMGAAHTLQPAAQPPKTITLAWNGKAWQKPTAGLPVTVTVLCQNPPVPPLPAAPTKAEALKLLGAARAQVNCSAGRHGGWTYPLREDSIQLGSVYEGNKQPRVNVTLSGNPYVQAYSRDMGKPHTLSYPTAYTITLVYQNGWRLQEPLAAAKTYAFNAACNQGNVGGGWYPRISGGRNPGGNAPITQPGTVASFPNPALSIPRTGDAPQMGLGAGLAVLALLGLAMYFGRRASAD